MPKTKFLRLVFHLFCVQLSIYTKTICFRSQIISNVCAALILIYLFFLIPQHEKEYREILDAVKGSEKEKRLASQFIGKFFKHFPNLADAAIEASLDLCEDDNIQIRRQAIKELPLLCKDTVEHVARISDILSQLLIVDDQLELQQVHMSLQQLLKYDAKSALTGVVSIRIVIMIFQTFFFFGLSPSKRN